MATADRIQAVLDDVRGVDGRAAAAAAERQTRLIKPPGSLGRLESVGARLAAIAGACPPPVPGRTTAVIAAADHGVHTQEVTLWPQRVTTAMVEQFCAGTAAVNALARTVGARVRVLDVGCATEPADHPLLTSRRIRSGTDDLRTRPAMSRADAGQAFLAGADVARELVASGVDLLVAGDMGIANTTASACLVAAFTGVEAGAVTGRGTGIDERMLAHKRRVVADALDLHAPDAGDPFGVLSAVGGLEHAALTGLFCAGAAARVPVVLDGVATNAAALAAAAVCDPVTGYLIAGHRSPEPAATIALDQLGLAPLLDLGMRLGEGTGGLLAVPLVTAAARALGDMATLTDLDLA